MMKRNNLKTCKCVLAVIASVVLVMALAVPCFADEPQTDSGSLWAYLKPGIDDEPDIQNFAYDYLYTNGYLKDIPLTDVGTCYGIVRADVPFFADLFISYFSFSSLAFDGAEGDIFSYTVDIPIGAVRMYNSPDGYSDIVLQEVDTFDTIGYDLSVRDTFSVSFYNEETGVTAFNVIYFYDSTSGTYVLDELFFYGENYMFTLNSDYETYYFDIAIFGYAGTDYGNLEQLVLAITDDSVYLSYPCGFYEGYTTAESTERPDGVVPPAKTGLYGQLYYILSDAIYGEGVTIGSSQEFILNQMASWLTYITILLPVLVVGIVLWRVFMR